MYNMNVYGQNLQDYAMDIFIVTQFYADTTFFFAVILFLIKHVPETLS